MPSQTCTPSAPRRCAHGSERQGRTVERATRPTPPSFTAPPWRTPPRRCLRGVQATTGSRTSGHKGMPVGAAARGPVSAAADAASPLHCPRTRLGCQTAFRPPVGSATRSNSRGALPPLAAPQGAHTEGTGAAALCPCHDFLSPPVPLVRRLRQSLRSWRSAAVPLLPAPEGGADSVCLSSGFSPSLHGFAMSCPRAPASRLDP